MRPDGRGAADRLIPRIAAACVLLTAAAMIWPAVGPVTLAATATGTCALALARRPARGLRVALAAIAAWIAVGAAGALALAGSSRAGLTFVLTFLFAAPAVVIPWIYARTFAPGGVDSTTRSTER